MIIQKLEEKNIISPPSWLAANCHYLAIVGSESYGANIAGSSDCDIQGFCIPPKDDIFPHLRGEIPGFGKQKKPFEVWQQHHCLDLSSKREYDFSVYSIVKFFDLAMQNNPNMLDIISVPANCVKHITSIGQMVRDKRTIFYHAGCFHKFRGYAFQQMSKIEKGVSRENSKRKDLIDKFGYDTKFLMHVVRLALECEQLLLTGELDLQRDSQTLLSVRRGEWTLEDGKKWWVEKERDLERAYINCKALPHVPRESEIKKLLLESLEAHYGSLTAAVVVNPDITNVLNDLQHILERYRK